LVGIFEGEPMERVIGPSSRRAQGILLAAATALILALVNAETRRLDKALAG
jgi:hypothetical protein